MLSSIFVDNGNFNYILNVNVVDAVLNIQDIAITGSLNPSFPFHNQEHPYFVSHGSHLGNFLPQ